MIPLDCSIALPLQNWRQGFGIPKESALVTHDDMLEELPSHEILEAWSRGEDPEWCERRLY